MGRQLHVVHDISVRSGGLGLAALRYSQSVAVAGADVTLLVASRTDDEIDPSSDCCRFRISYGAPESSSKDLRRVMRQFSVLRALITEGGFDFVHLHGTWSPVLFVAYYLATLARLPCVISPHGCLEPWALRHKRIKKVIALSLYQRRMFNKAKLLVATAKEEMQSIRALGLKTAVAVIPNGVDLSDVLPSRTGVKKQILFLSRIHPIKGLEDLVKAWSRIKRSGWSVIVAGPDEGGYLCKIKDLARVLGVEQDFSFPGLVLGKEKERLFDQSAIFILPTYSENFGIAVAEALARCVPVITTTGAPWEDIVRYKCGWWVTPGLEGVSMALEQAMDTDFDTLREMGDRGRSLVESKFSWPVIGKSGVEIGDWIIGKQQTTPVFVNN